MSYQVLARKWRPRNFASLVGQEHVVKALPWLLYGLAMGVSPTQLLQTTDLPLSNNCSLRGLPIFKSLSQPST